MIPSADTSSHAAHDASFWDAAVSAAGIECCNPLKLALTISPGPGYWSCASPLWQRVQSCCQWPVNPDRSGWFSTKPGDLRGISSRGERALRLSRRALLA